MRLANKQERCRALIGVGEGECSRDQGDGGLGRNAYAGELRQLGAAWSIVRYGQSGLAGSGGGGIEDQTDCAVRTRQQQGRAIVSFSEISRSGAGNRNGSDGEGLVADVGESDRLSSARVADRDAAEIEGRWRQGRGGSTNCLRGRAGDGDPTDAGSRRDGKWGAWNFGKRAGMAAISLAVRARRRRGTVEGRRGSG